MIKEFWINLPVKDIKRSKDFFNQIGFSFNAGPGNTATSACMIMGSHKTVVMLFEEPSFKNFIGHEISDTKNGTEVLFSFDVESREEVDEIAKKVADAGGIIFGKPGEVMGWMYGCGFVDIDGHRWNAIFMDPTKMKQPS